MQNAQQFLMHFDAKCIKIASGAQKVPISMFFIPIGTLKKQYFW